MTSTEAYVALNLLPGIGPLRVSQLLSLFGEPAAILAASRRELATVPGIGDKLAAVLCTWRDQCDPEVELRAAERSGVCIITREDAAYPPLLREIHDPPLCLYVRGELSALDGLRDAVALVGSRHTTTYGIKVAENLATAAAFAGWTVVSGLARGIDTVAHDSVLKAGGRTVAVLGSGLSCVYPQENIELARRIAAQNGAVVSEFPMMFRPEKRTFPMRNRIISGMTRGTIVVEAGLKSGSLITAAQALDQNRQVFAVPGRIDSPQSRGCHGLIKDGAKLVENFQDVLEEFIGFQDFPGITQAAANADAPTKSRRIRLDDLQLSDIERKLLGVLGEAESPVDDLLATLDEPPAKILGAIVALEMRRLVRQLPGKRVMRLVDVAAD